MYTINNGITYKTLLLLNGAKAYKSYEIHKLSLYVSNAH